MPLDLNRHFQLKEGADTTGVPIEIQDAKIWIRRSGNPSFIRALAQVQRQHATAVLRDELKDEEDLDLTVKLMAEHILVNWENIQVDGEDLPYSVENAEMVLRRFQLFREEISHRASNLATFREVALDEAGKDSSDDSSGS